jgi:hypothetical protein
MISPKVTLISGHSHQRSNDTGEGKTKHDATAEPACGLEYSSGKIASDARHGDMNTRKRSFTSAENRSRLAASHALFGGSRSLEFF